MALLASEGESLLRSWNKTKEHPLSLLSGINFPDRRNPGEFFTQDELLTVLGECWELVYQRVDVLKISLEVVGSILPHAYVDRLNIVPIEIDAEKVVIMTSEPFALSWVDEVKSQLKRKVEIRLNTPKQIKHLLNEIYVVQKAFKAMAQDQGFCGTDKLRLLREGKIDELEMLIEKSWARKLGAQDGYITKIVDWLINFATLERASDIHLEPKRAWARFGSGLMEISEPFIVWIMKP